MATFNALPVEEDLNVTVDLPAIAEALGKQDERDDAIGRGTVNSVVEGLTMSTGDELKAMALSIATGEDYDYIRTNYLMEQEKFERENPGTSLAAEMIPAIISGYGLARGVGTAGGKLLQSSRINRGKESFLYTTKKGKVKQVTIDAKLKGGKTRIKDGNNTYVVNNSTLKPNMTLADAEPLGSGVLGMTEGAIYGAGEGEGFEGRVQSAAFGLTVGGLAGATIDKVINAGTSRLARTFDDDVADENLLNIPNESQFQRFTNDLDEANRGFEGPRQGGPNFSQVDDLQFDNARGQNQNIKPWREATNAGELWDGIKKGFTDFYDEQLTGASDMLGRRVSKMVQGLYERSDTTALRQTVIEGKAFFDPLKRVVDLEIEDKNFHELLIRYATGDSLPEKMRVDSDQLKAYVTNALGEDDANALIKYLDYSKAKNKVFNRKVNGSEEVYDSMGNYLHTKLTPDAKARKGKLAGNELDEELDFPGDPGQMQRTRGQAGWDGDDYLPVLATDFRRIMNNERLAQLALKFQMPMPKPGTTPTEFFEAFEKHLISRGITPDAAKLAKETISENMVGQNKSPWGWIQGVNSLAYLLTLAGPKSAVLNLHDPMVAVANQGFKAGRNIFNRGGYQPRGAGIDQNVGEFLQMYNDLNRLGPKDLEKYFADVARGWTDKGMRASGFAAFDDLGKRGVLNVILQSAVDDVAADRLTKSWGFYFSPKELKVIERNLKKHGLNIDGYDDKGAALIEELAFAGLGQQQLISGAGRPRGWSRNPNMRPMWALRGFAIKQQALAMRNVVENIQEGNTREAIKWLSRYALMAAGTFGLINEARQWLAGDGEASTTGVLMGMADQMVSLASLNTIGMNDYQYGKIMEDGLIPTFLRSLEPIALSRPRELAVDTYKAITDSDVGPDEPANQFPIIKQPQSIYNNLKENVGVDILRDPVEIIEQGLNGARPNPQTLTNPQVVPPASSS